MHNQQQHRSTNGSGREYQVGGGVDGGGGEERRRVAVINSPADGGAVAHHHQTTYASPAVTNSLYATSSSPNDEFDRLSRDHPHPTSNSTPQHRRQQEAAAIRSTSNGGVGSNNNNDNNHHTKTNGQKMVSRVRYLNERGPAASWAQYLYMKKFGVLVIALEIAFIVLFAIFVRYGAQADAAKAASSSSVESHIKNHEQEALTTTSVLELITRRNGSAVGVLQEEEAEPPLEQFYPMFQDIHVMMFIGFGFLMTFLKRYSYSAVGVNFVLAAFVIQWAVLVEGFFDLHNGVINVGVKQMIAADFAAAAVLISMGALLGKLSPEQYIIMGLFEVVFYTVNEYILFELWSVTDAGDSMTVHTFGAYFGLTVARVMYRKGQHGHVREGPSYTSDIFAMIGTIFLWVYWPSFNGGLAEGDQRHRAVFNTYVSLAACCLVSYAVSALLNHENKFDMVHIQNSTLAGGVAIGTSANLMIQPFGALIVGSLAGVISVVGYKYVTPFLARKLGVHDTCGVNNLHGVPGILAAIVGAIVCGFADAETYGHNLYKVFPQLEHGRTSWGQTAWQFAGLGVTMGIAIGGGLITGLILRLPCWIQLDEPSLYDDEDFWELPEEHAGGVSPVDLEQGQMYLAKRDINGEMELEKVHQAHHHYT